MNVAKAAAPLPFWDDPAPSCPSSQLQQVPLQGTFPLPPTECSALPVCPSTSPGHSPRPANKVASSVRTDSCFPLRWKGTRSCCWPNRCSSPRVTRNHHPESPCDQRKGTAPLIHVGQEMHWAILRLGAQLFLARMGAMQK